MRDKRSNKTKGYGFVSFKDPADFTRAIKVRIQGDVEQSRCVYRGCRAIKMRILGRDNDQGCP